MSNPDFDIPAKSAKPMRRPQSAAETEVSPRVEEVEKTDKDSPKASAGPKYDKNELLAIFDEIIFTGEYVEEVLLRGRVPVKFSTRSAKQVDEVQAVLDSAGYTLISSVEQRRSILSLEQSLVSFNGKDLSKMPKDERSKFVSQLAGPVIAVLMEELSKFDLKVAAACREEANF